LLQAAAAAEKKKRAENELEEGFKNVGAGRRERERIRRIILAPLSDFALAATALTWATGGQGRLATFSPGGAWRPRRR
jgi:ABC-type sulfate transport system permease component